MTSLTNSWKSLLAWPNALHDWLSPLGLRLLLAYEFWVAGKEKQDGENWFHDLHGNFPFPFNLVPPEISWQLATWTELIGRRPWCWGWRHVSPVFR
jgi:putative oxidoreductase